MKCRVQDIPLEDITIINGEVFKAVPATSNKLACSASGVFIGRHRRVLKPREQTSGYQWYAYINEDGKYRNVYAHRGVALAWLCNPHTLPYVNHIDGDKYNNAACNLEWCTAKHNTQHAIERGLSWNLPKKGQCGFQSSPAAS